MKGQPNAVKSDWSHVIIPKGVALMGVLEGVPGAKLADPLVFAADGSTKQASPNHEVQAWGIEAARAAHLMSSKPTDTSVRFVSQLHDAFDAAKRTLLEAYFPRELAIGPKGIGLWASEQGCPDSHDGQHLNGTSMARLAAWLSKDPELLEWSEKLVLTTVRALLCVATPDLTVWQAGFRAPGEPTSSAATAWLRMALKHKQQGAVADSRREAMVREGKPDPMLDPFYLQTRVLDYLRKAGDPLLARTATMTRERDAAPCTLKYPMEVYRSRDGRVHLSRLVGVPDGTRDACDWVMASDHGVDWSKDGSQRFDDAGMSLAYRFPGIGESRQPSGTREKGAGSGR